MDKNSINKGNQNRALMAEANELSEVSQVDYSRKWYVLAAAGMGILLGTIDASIVNVALPTLSSEFHTSFGAVQWVALAYMLTMSTLTLTMGRLGDIAGKKQIYAVGMVIFTLGSVLCGLANSIYWLIGFRVFQAIGASMTAALGTAIVTEAFPAEERGKAIGAAGAFVSIGIVTGPALGGTLIGFISWRWIFFVNIPIGIIAITLTLRYVHNIKSTFKQRFDYWGAITIFIGQFAFLLALTAAQRLGFGHPLVLVFFTLFIVFLVFFIMVEKKIQFPMVDLVLFKNKIFSINLLNSFVTFLALGGVIVLMPFYLENVLGYDPFHVGLIMAVLPVAGGIVSPISGALSDRFGSGPITILGLLFMVGGFFGLTNVSTQTTTIVFIFTYIPVGLGMAVFQSPNNSSIMGTAPHNRMGFVSSMLPITRTLGNSTGIAALGAIWTGRMAFYAGGHVSKNLKKIPAIAQVQALRETFFIVGLLMIIPLILAIWGLLTQKKNRYK